MAAHPGAVLRQLVLQNFWPDDAAVDTQRLQRPEALAWHLESHLSQDIRNRVMVFAAKHFRHLTQVPSLSDVQAMQQRLVPGDDLAVVAGLSHWFVP